MTLRHSEALMPDLLHLLLIPSVFMESVTGTSSGINLQSDVIKSVVGNDKFPQIPTFEWLMSNL